MPKIFSEIHDCIIKKTNINFCFSNLELIYNFIMDRNSRSSDRDELIFPLCSNGYIIPCLRIFRILSNLTNKIQVLFFISILYLNK